MKNRKPQLSNQSFTKVFVSANYAEETLINGNISECIKYLKDLLECGNIGINTVYDELNSIKSNVPDRYNFIKTSVFTVFTYDDFQIMRLNQI